MPPTYNGPREQGPHEVKPTVHAAIVLLPELALEPKLTVVTPVHNGGAFIAKTLAATLATTSGEFELVLVLDECSDDSMEQAARLLLNHVNSSFVHELNRWWFEHGRHLHRGNNSAATDHAEDTYANPERNLTLEPLDGVEMGAGVPTEWLKACMALNGIMVQARLIVAPTAMFETMSENRGFQVCR